jgi:hypothetical protein
MLCARHQESGLPQLAELAQAAQTLSQLQPLKQTTRIDAGWDRLEGAKEEQRNEKQEGGWVQLPEEVPSVIRDSEKRQVLSDSKSRDSEVYENEHVSRLMSWLPNALEDEMQDIQENNLLVLQPYTPRSLNPRVRRSWAARDGPAHAPASSNNRAAAIVRPEADLGSLLHQNETGDAGRRKGDRSPAVASPDRGPLKASEGTTVVATTCALLAWLLASTEGLMLLGGQEVLTCDVIGGALGVIIASLSVAVAASSIWSMLAFCVWLLTTTTGVLLLCELPLLIDFFWVRLSFSAVLVSVLSCALVRSILPATRTSKGRQVSAAGKIPSNTWNHGRKKPVTVIFALFAWLLTTVWGMILLSAEAIQPVSLAMCLASIFAAGGIAVSTWSVLQALKGSRFGVYVGAGLLVCILVLKSLVCLSGESTDWFDTMSEVQRFWPSAPMRPDIFLAGIMQLMLVRSYRPLLLKRYAWSTLWGVVWIKMVLGATNLLAASDTTEVGQYEDKVLYAIILLQCLVEPKFGMRATVLVIAAGSTLAMVGCAGALLDPRDGQDPASSTRVCARAMLGFRSTCGRTFMQSPENLLLAVESHAANESRRHQTVARAWGSSAYMRAGSLQSLQRNHNKKTAKLRKLQKLQLKQAHDLVGLSVKMNTKVLLEA